MNASVVRKPAKLKSAYNKGKPLSIVSLRYSLGVLKIVINFLFHDCVRCAEMHATKAKFLLLLEKQNYEIQTTSFIVLFMQSLISTELSAVS